MVLIFGDILPYDTFREDFQRGREFVFLPTRRGPRLFRRNRAGLLRRMRIPQVMEFIDERKALIAVVEDCEFQVRRLPGNWQWRYLGNRNQGPEILGLQDSVLGFNPDTVPPRGAFQAEALLEGCVDGGCGGRVANERVVEESFYERETAVVDDYATFRY